MNSEPHAAERIVVGVDGSEASKDALRWAVQQAEREHSTVDAVIAWEYPPLYGSIGWIDAPQELATDMETSASQTLGAAIDALEGAGGGPSVRAVVAYGTATGVLREAARDASLLVLGSRKQGLFGGVLHGSVRRHVTRQAPCPVVVI
ncbi:universal stress protein [Streptomyces sp. NPDC048611]|uniref:universal stress protein n=1 Tax=Streptomyces sp. NPDC048611 TaxID=3155635 RepID=UPI00341AE877